MPPRLDGAITLVPDADTPRGAALARALATAGTRAVVLCGANGAALGALARELEEVGCRSALFLGDATADAGDLVEMVHELFVAREQPESTEGSQGGGH